MICLTWRDGQRRVNETTMTKRTYKYETHLHTKEASACASSTGAEMVRSYKASGYSGIIVTDHFLNGNTAVPENLPWETRVELFCKGYQNALDEAKRCGLRVFFGWEFTCCGADFLTYGLDKAFLLENPDIATWDIKKYSGIIHQKGGFISYAHPFRDETDPECLRLYAKYVDAVEVVNTRNKNPESDKKAFQYAKEYSLLQTCGSDAHDVQALDKGGMSFDHELHSIDDFIKAVVLNDSRSL